MSACMLMGQTEVGVGVVVGVGFWAKRMHGKGRWMIALLARWKRVGIWTVSIWNMCNSNSSALQIVRWFLRHDSLREQTIIHLSVPE